MPGLAAGATAGALLLRAGAGTDLGEVFGHPGVLLGAAGVVAFLGTLAAVAMPRFAQAFATALAVGAALTSLVVRQGATESAYVAALVAVAVAAVGVAVAATLFHAGLPPHPGTVVGTVTGGGLATGAVVLANRHQLGRWLPPAEDLVALALAVVAIGTVIAVAAPAWMRATGLLAGLGAGIAALVARTAGAEPGYWWALAAHAGAWLAVAAVGQAALQRSPVALGHGHQPEVVLSPLDYEASPAEVAEQPAEQAPVTS